MTTFPQQLREVRKQGQDFEWYPTSSQIITALVQDLKYSISKPHYREENQNSFLDIGAGNGKVIKEVSALENIGRCFAIEKSPVLLDLLPPEVMILGTDFWKTSLIDKSIRVIFSNPPYSEYELWTAKILSEAPTGTRVYLVIPDRWENSAHIQEALRSRKIKPEILGSYDFLESEDRAARAKVHLLCIKFPEHRRDEEAPFTKFFDATFKYPEPAEFKEPEAEYDELGAKLTPIEALIRSHDSRIVELQQNYFDVCKIPRGLLEEFGITKDSLCESLRQKLATTKAHYWKCLFQELASVRERLTYKSSEKMREQLAKETGIEFTRDNVYAVIAWVVKNAYAYFDEQLVATYENLVEHANVENYKSNKRIFQKDRFGYRAVCDKDSDVSHYRLKVGHRMVLERVGGLSPKHYSFDKGDLSHAGAEFISDLLTVANNLGFISHQEGPGMGDWADSQPRVYTFKRGKGKPESLFRIRTFQNSNIHIQLHPDFVNALNIQHGKLKGWLRNDTQASEELDLPPEVVAKYFNGMARIEMQSLGLPAPQ